MRLQRFDQIWLGPLDGQNTEAVLIPWEVLHDYGLRPLNVKREVVNHTRCSKGVEYVWQGYRVHLSRWARPGGVMVRVVANDATEGPTHYKLHLGASGRPDGRRDVVATAVQQSGLVLGQGLHADACPTEVAFQHQGVRHLHRVVGREVEEVPPAPAAQQRGDQPVLSDLRMQLASLAQRRVRVVVGQQHPLQRQHAPRKAWHPHLVLVCLLGTRGTGISPSCQATVGAPQ
mmetsp:Transcript_70917/g.219225  ORF Transcript_70917/g.219225 Transcript_70917/m.219225 type:complete len:231 (-) Transcript_70917:202-894(-)